MIKTKLPLCPVCRVNLGVRITGVGQLCMKCWNAVALAAKTALEESDIFCQIGRDEGEGVWIYFTAPDEEWEERAEEWDIIHDLTLGEHYAQNKATGRRVRVEQTNN